ncbi:MAG: SDR family NAD(P)-dependent oxidoreductase, partial [Acidimicrobiia bacterium]
GKGAVVTGAASGIGRGIAEAFARRGADVVVADIEADRAAEVASTLEVGGTRAIAVGCDVTDASSIEDLAARAWEELGHVDVLVNNAGVFSSSPFLSIDEANARWVLDVNVMGVFFGCQVFGRRFVEQGTPAHIVNTGSENSLGMPHTNAAMYTATKHAVLALSDVLRNELPDFIGVSILCPGVVASDLQTATRNRHERYGGPTPSGRSNGAPTGFGLTPDVVGERVAEGVERGDFYIVTHPPVVELASERWDEISAAFAAQAPRFEGDDRLDTRALLRGMNRP